MDYEKAYKNLVAKVKNAHLYAQTDSTKNVLEDILPELRESEDERIRKVLINIVKGACNKYGIKYRGDEITEEMLLAYLEKQKEQKPLIKKGVKYYCIKAQKRNTDFHTYAFTIGTEYTAPENNVLIDNDGHSWDLTRQTPEWIFERFTPKEQKPAEKQDYSGLTDLERAIHRGFLSAGVDNVPVTIIKETAQECLAQMRPAEWSEEDEKMLADIIFKLAGFMGNEKNIAWLKSLRPSWKPSDEQMNYLSAAVIEAQRRHNESTSGFPRYRVLKELYEQLLKL